MASRVSGLGPVIPKTEFPDTGLPLAPKETQFQRVA